MIDVKVAIMDLADDYFVHRFIAKNMYRELVQELNLDKKYLEIWEIKDHGKEIYQIVIYEKHKPKIITKSKKMFTNQEVSTYENILTNLRKKFDEMKRDIPISPFMEELYGDMEFEATIELSNGSKYIAYEFEDVPYYDDLLKDYILIFRVMDINQKDETPYGTSLKVRLSSIIGWTYISPKKF